MSGIVGNNVGRGSGTVEATAEVIANRTVDTMTGDASDTTLALSQSPGSENNVSITFDGVMQHHDTYSLSGSTITFGTAPALGVKVEAVSGGLESIGTTSDDTVTGAKIVDNAIDSEHYTDGSIDLAHLSANSVDSDQYVDGSIDAIHLSANSVDSDAYVDGSIDTAHIANDQITLALMAPGTDGNIISYDASGNPVAIATGNDGQVLTSTGAGSPPAFEDAGGATVSQGVFTPTVQDTSYSDSESQTYTIQKGWYTKVNDIVHFDIQMIFNSLGTLDTGSATKIAGLPFASTALSNYEASVVCGYGASMAIVAGGTPSGYIAASKTYMEITLWDAAYGITALSLAEFSAGALLFISGSYRAA